MKSTNSGKAWGAARNLSNNTNNSGFPAVAMNGDAIVVDDEIALVGDTMFGIWPGSAFPPFATDVRR